MAKLKDLPLSAAEQRYVNMRVAREIASLSPGYWVDHDTFRIFFCDGGAPEVLYDVVLPDGRAYTETVVLHATV